MELTKKKLFLLQCWVSFFIVCINHSPSKAQGLTKAASVWQVSSQCSFSMHEKDVNSEISNVVMDSRCFGISVTKRRNYNIHFYSSHPESSTPSISFVMAEGPFKGDHPIESVILFLGQKNQTLIPVDGGKCQLTDDSPLYAIVKCSSGTSNKSHERLLLVTAYSFLGKPIAPEIRSALE